MRFYYLSINSVFYATLFFLKSNIMVLSSINANVFLNLFFYFQYHVYTFLTYLHRNYFHNNQLIISIIYDYNFLNTVIQIFFERRKMNLSKLIFIN